MVVEISDYRLIVGNLKTGKIQADLPMASVKVGQRLNAAGTVGCTLRPRSRAYANHDLANITAATVQFMAIDYRGTILEAGPIWDQDLSPDGSSLTLSGLGLWSVFDRRKNLNWGDLLAGKAAQLSRISTQRGHLGSIGAEWVRESIVANPDGALPLVLPADIPGTAYLKEVNGFNLTWIGEDLRDLTKEEGGPDLRFRPQYVAGDASRIEWVMEHGAVDVLTQSGADWAWDAKVERSPLTSVGVKRDGTRTAARAWVPGAGQEQAMKVGTHEDRTLLDAGYPYLEVEDSANNEEDQATLNRLARRLQSDSSRPWDQWTLSVRADQYPELGAYLPGDWALVNPPEGHPIIPASTGKVRVRILAVDADGSTNVKLSVAPIQGAV